MAFVSQGLEQVDQDQSTINAFINLTNFTPLLLLTCLMEKEEDNYS